MQLGCGNGLVEAGEDCDDHNSDEADGCSPTCILEAGFACDQEPSVCEPTCGNGEPERGEVCDDGNAEEGDGCSSMCTTEAGFVCSLPAFGAPSVCTDTCGNGAFEEGSELCDDSADNNSDNDDCPGTCVPAFCGDGFVWSEGAGQEECDSGLDNSDTEPNGCRTNCLNAHCGDGVLDDAEGCDDGDQEPGDGCSASCAVESGWACDAASPTACGAANAPPSPTVDGEASAFHKAHLKGNNSTLVWRWNVPVGTSYFRYSTQLPNGTPDEGMLDASITEYRMNDVPPTSGVDYSFRIRACNGADACSAETTFRTRVELLNSSYRAGSPWRGIAHDVATSPLGNRVALSCHNCFEGDGDGILSLTTIGTKVSRAYNGGDGADLIELDVAYFTNGTAQGPAGYYVSHGDDNTAAGEPLLESVLGLSALRDSNALLFIQLSENWLARPTFARGLLDIINAHREFARNGRHLWIRADQKTIVGGSHSRMDYLVAIRDLLDEYPFIKNYIRFSVLYWPDDDTGTAASPGWYDIVDTDVAANGFDGAEFARGSASLSAALEYTRSLGLMAGVFTLDALDGEVYTASLREDADQLTMDYRVSLAREIVEAREVYQGTSTASTIIAHVDARPLAAGSRSINAWSSDASGTLSSSSRSLAQTFHPAVTRGARGASLFGGQLTYVEAETDRLSTNVRENHRSAEGVLVNAVVRFDTLNIANGTTMAIACKAEAGAYCLELYKPNSSTPTQLRFSVHVPGTGYIEASVAASSVVNTSASFAVTGVFDGDGGVYLFVNHVNVTPSPIASGVGMTPTSNLILVGANPTAGDGSSEFFDGAIQRLSVLRWGAHYLGPLNTPTQN